MGKYINRIKDIRKAKKMTQAELSRLVGVSTAYITMIENGDRDMDTSLMRRIAQALKVKPYELLPVEEQPETLTEEEKEFLRLFRKSKANNSNADTTAKAE